MFGQGEYRSGSIRTLPPLLKASGPRSHQVCSRAVAIASRASAASSSVLFSSPMTRLSACSTARISASSFEFIFHRQLHRPPPALRRARRRPPRRPDVLPALALRLRPIDEGHISVHRYPRDERWALLFENRGDASTCLPNGRCDSLCVGAGVAYVEDPSSCAYKGASLKWVSADASVTSQNHPTARRDGLDPLDVREFGLNVVDREVLVMDFHSQACRS